MHRQPLSPLDGRYAAATEHLASLFSEQALISYRYRIELDWLKVLIGMDGCGPAPSPAALKVIDRLLDQQPADLAQRVKQKELETRHDVKALELCLADDLRQHGLAELVSWIHFACTSWDINNLAYALMLQEANKHLAGNTLASIQQELDRLACENATLAMLGRTHGQPASPTTLGKELRVFERRLARQIDKLRDHRFDGKFNGAVGNYNAHCIAAPDVDWPAVSRDFVERLGLGFSAVTTQVEPYDGMAEYFDIMVRCNHIVIDLAQDMSAYFSLGYLRRSVPDKQVGSSTMPHKLNPIEFENAEGNLAVANSLLQMFGRELQVSRLQRDLSDSTILRNLGVALGHCAVAYGSVVKGLRQGLAGDEQATARDLDDNWQVLTEALQTVMRSIGRADAYEEVRRIAMPQGRMTKSQYAELVEKLLPAGEQRDALLQLTPQTYLGRALDLALGSGASSDVESPAKEK